MANTFNTIQAAGIVAKVAAQTLSDNLKFAKSIAQEPASTFDGKNGYKAGDTISISVPARYVPQNTFDITSSIQDTVEEKKALTLDVISTVGMEIDSFEVATEMDMQSLLKRAVMPAAVSIAHDVESTFLTKATQSVYNSVGTAGSNGFTVADVLAGRTKLNQNLCPQDDERFFLLNSASGAKAVDARKGLFQSSDEIAKQYKGGYVGTADGFNWMENELIYTHTNGNDVTGVAVNDAGVAEGATTLAIDGLTNTTGNVKKGQVFTIAGVNMVHPQTKTDMGVLQQFVVTADATANGSGQATISISPAIRAGSGGLQNVTALPANDAALVFVGAASSTLAQSLQFHREAFRMVSVPLVMPTAVELAAQETVDGITVQVVRSFDILKRRMVTRLDFLGGITDVRPEWAVRVTA